MTEVTVPYPHTAPALKAVMMYYLKAIAFGGATAAGVKPP